MRACLLAVALLLALAAPAAAQVPPLPGPPGAGSGSPTLDPAIEARNYSKTGERQALYDTPQGQLLCAR
jgi:hypothetical protein